MTKRVRTAIEAVLGTENFDDMKIALEELRDAWKEHRGNVTLTMQRIEFLEERLQEGLNKRAAARALVAHDPRIGRRTAETLVYTTFSGQYQDPYKKRTSSTEMARQSRLETPIDIEAEEDLL